MPQGNPPNQQQIPCPTSANLSAAPNGVQQVIPAASQASASLPGVGNPRLSNIITTAGGTTAAVGATTLAAAGAYVGYTAAAAEAAEATTSVAYLSAGLGFGDAIVNGAIAGAALGADVGVLVAIPVVIAVPPV